MQSLYRRPIHPLGVSITCGGGLVRCKSLMLWIHLSISAGFFCAFSMDLVRRMTECGQVLWSYHLVHCVPYSSTIQSYPKMVLCFTRVPPVPQRGQHVLLQQSRLSQGTSEAAVPSYQYSQQCTTSVWFCQFPEVTHVTRQAHELLLERSRIESALLMARGRGVERDMNATSWRWERWWWFLPRAS